MYKIILDINSHVELTAFYTKVNNVLYVEKVFIYENGIETKSTTDISAKCIDELKVKLINEYSNNGTDRCLTIGKGIS